MESRLPYMLGLVVQLLPFCGRVFLKLFHVSIGMASMIVAIIMITFAFSTTDHRYILVQFYIRLYIAFVLIYLQIYMCTVRICG